MNFAVVYLLLLVAGFAGYLLGLHVAAAQLRDREHALDVEWAALEREAHRRLLAGTLEGP